MGIKKADHTKARGVVYTPAWLADLVLSPIPQAAWRGAGLCADFSCGDGAFLERMCEASLAAHRAAGFADAAFSRWAADCLWGSDVDPAALGSARARLDAWAQSRGFGGAGALRWRLEKRDLLSGRLAAELGGRCSVVAGNPPYVRIQNLDAQARKAAQALAFCARGSTDLYLACFELGLKFLAPNGWLSFVAPSSWLRAKAGQAMRDELARGGWARSVVDFGHCRPFPGVGAYCAVATLQKSHAPGFGFMEWDAAKNAPGPARALPASSWLADPPLGDSVSPGPAGSGPGLFDERGLRRDAQLGELCKLGVGFATLADSVFMSDEAPLSVDEERGLCAFHKEGKVHWLESAVARPLVKASTSKPPKARASRWILHPYRQGAGGRAELIPEAELKELAPRAHAYLKARKKALMARDKGKVDPAAWHGYGRSQGLRFSFEAWAAAPSLSKEPQFFEMPKTAHGLPVAFVSGLGVGFDAPAAARARLMRALNSEAMAKHMARAGADYSGGYKSYNKNAVKTFRLDPLSAGVRWFSSQDAFGVWAASDDGADAGAKARAAARAGDFPKAWRLAKAKLGDALRSEGSEPSAEPARAAGASDARGAASRPEEL